MNKLSPGSVDHKYAIGENTTLRRRLGDFSHWCLRALEPQNGSAFCAEEDGRAWVCMYPSSRRFRCDLDTFPVCRVVNRVIREDTRKDSMYIDTALKDEEDKKDLGGRTHTDDEGVYGHSITRHDGRGRRLDFVPSVCKRRGSLTPAHPWVSPSPLSST